MEQSSLNPKRIADTPRIYVPGARDKDNTPLCGGTQRYAAQAAMRRSISAIS